MLSYFNHVISSGYGALLSSFVLCAPSIMEVTYGKPYQFIAIGIGGLWPKRCFTSNYEP